MTLCQQLEIKHVINRELSLFIFVSLHEISVNCVFITFFCSSTSTILLWDFKYLMINQWYLLVQ